MKNLVKRMYKGRPTLFIGNNRKPIGYDNWYGEQYALEGNNITEASIIFFDLDNAASLLGINDVNDVSQWNTVMNWDYSAFLTESSEAIEFESVIIDGNKVSFIPFDNDYTVIKGFDWYQFDNVGEYLLENVIIYYNGIDLNYFEVDGIVVAQNVDSSNFNLVYEDNEPFILYMNSQGITEFTGTNLTNVTEIDLNGNDLSEFDATNTGLSNLITLYLSNNPSLDTFNATTLDSIKKITLNANNFTAFNPISELNTLTHLELGTNQLTEFDYPLPSLTNLDLGNNSLLNFDATQYDGLITLNLSINSLTGITIANLTSLQNIYLQNNQLSNIDLTGLINVKSLRLTLNSLTTIDISSLDNVTDLELNNNDLDTSSINSILAKLVANGDLNGFLLLQAGTNAAPTGQGITDVNTLITRGWFVLTN